MITRTSTLLLALGLSVPGALWAQEPSAAGGSGGARPDTTAAAAEAQAPPAAQEAEAQDTSRTADEAPRLGDPRLVFEREVFSYPAFGRRNPFLSLVGDASGPRFEQMRLEMIIYSEDPQRSMALLSAGRQGAAAADAANAALGRSARLRVGERWGNVRIVGIRPTQVVVAVEEFGLTEQRTMDLPTRGQGGSR